MIAIEEKSAGEEERPHQGDGKVVDSIPTVPMPPVARTGKTAKNSGALLKLHACLLNESLDHGDHERSSQENEGATVNFN